MGVFWSNILQHYVSDRIVDLGVAKKYSTPRLHRENVRGSTHRAFNDLIDFFELGFGFGADSPNSFLKR
jgi:hypothetical protein